LSVHALEMMPAEYDITHNENGHIELYGEEFDPTSTHYIDERVTLNAVCDTYGYMFVKWIDADGNKISVDPDLDLTFTAEKTVVKAVFGPFQPYSELRINGSEGGSVLFNGAPYDFNDDYFVGDKVQLSAIADEGYTFAYWMNGNNQIVSHDAVINVTLSNVTEFTAYFTKADSSTATVIFYDRIGRVVSTATVAKGETITLPALPSSYGYTYQGWVVDNTIMEPGSVIAVDGDMTIKISYVKNDDSYKVIVNGGKVNGTQSATFVYNTKVTVVFDSSLLADGEVFGGWHVEGTASDASVISYETRYTFYVGADTVLTAVIATSADVKPVTDVTDTSLVDGGKKVTFLTERSVPTGYTLIEAGVIYTADDNKSDILTLDNVAATVRKRVATTTTPNGQLRMTLSSRDGSAINVYLVSYLTYLDTAGDTHTIYSSVYSLTTASSTDSQDKIEDSTDIF
ncbi:MAG: InlB B-repeat-containing protein, partial [Clostridia bacterium]|nr:InlB B-repeat-containing protein [Clostridia bacterium]